MKKVSIIIPSHNEGEWLKITVLGIFENTDYSNYEIIVVADGCTDDSTDFFIKEKFPNLKLIQNKKSIGLAPAKNLGARSATGDYYVFLDSHVIPQTKNWLSEIVKHLENPKIGLVTLKPAPIDDLEKHYLTLEITDFSLNICLTWYPDSQDVIKVPYVFGFCLGIRRALFDKTNGFDADMIKWSWEDFEYTIRLWLLGYENISSPNAIVAHRWKNLEERNFELKRDFLDYNLARMVISLFTPKWQKKVFQELFKDRPDIFACKIVELLVDNKFIERRNNLHKQFVRTFDDYLKEFADFWKPFQD